MGGTAATRTTRHGVAGAGRLNFDINPSLTVQGVSGEGEGGGGEEVDPEAWEAELQEMLDMHSEPTTQS